MRHALALLIALWLAVPAARAQSPRPQPPRLELWVSRDIAPGPKVRLRLNARNVPAVTLTATPVDGRAWLLRRDRGDRKPQSVRPVGARRVVGTVRLRPSGETARPGRVDDYRSRQFNLPPLPPGVWRIAAQGAGAEASGIVNVTNLAVVVQRAPRTALVWVTDHRTGRAVRGARVELVDAATGRSSGGRTGADGVVRFAARPAPSESLLVTAGRDLAGLALGAEEPDGRLVAHLATDRPIYRPGQRVSFRAILRTTRGQGYSPVTDGAVHLEVRDPRDIVVERRDLTPTPMGTVSGQFDLSPEVATGPCTIVLTHARRSAYATFTVGTYRKPEFTAAAVPVQPRYLAGEKAAFTVTARTFFGAPVPQAEVRWRVRRADLPFSPDGGGGDDPSFFAGGDGNLYPSDSWRSDPFVAEGEARTDAAGVARIEVASVAGAPDSLYLLEATVTDSQNRPGEASASVPVYGAALRLGLRADDLCVALGDAFPIEVRAADQDGAPRPAVVTLVVRRQVWEKKTERWVWKEVGRAAVRVPASGKAVTRLPASAEGDLQIVATAPDDTGRTARAAASVWVAGPDYRPEREEPQVRVRLDRRTYRFGQTATVYVTPASPTRPTLVTLEGADLFRYRVLPPGRGTRVWKIPVDAALSPNAFVDAQQWAAPSRLLSAAATLAAPDPSRRLRVEVVPERPSYQPGETVQGTVRLTDDRGNPVRGEVGLAVVDEALFAVRPDTTPDPVRTFWGLRPNATRTFQSAPEELSGGAFQRANGDSAPLRQRFVDTAHWDAHLLTGADGTASFAFEAPGNLTRWRFTAVGVTSETRVGRSTASALATRPVTLRLATPRQAVVGDRWTLIGTVDNRTDRERRFTVRLSDASGLTIPADAARAVTVSAGGQGTVTWDVSVDRWPAAGEVAVTGGVRDVADPDAADLSDRMRAVVAVLPEGVRERRVALARVGAQEARIPFVLPPGHGPPVTVRVEAQVGLTAAAVRDARRVLASRPTGPEDAADTLEVAVAARNLPGVAATDRAVRDALSLLARSQNSDGGWGAWEESPTDPWTTARVVRALAGLRPDPAAGTVFPDSLMARAVAGAVRLFAQTDLWEARAWLADSLRAAGYPKAADLRDEVARRGIALSPYARLLLALPPESPTPDAPDIDPALALSGTRSGWRASTDRTLATALAAEGDPAQGQRLARSLAFPETLDGFAWRTRSDQAAAAVALTRWLRGHPEASPGATRLAAALGDGPFLPLGDDGTADLPVDGDPGDALTVRVRRESGSAEAFVAATVVVARRVDQEEGDRMRLLRRFEVLLPDGTWRDLARSGAPDRAQWSVRPGDLVRVTLALWPSDRTRLASVTQVLPAGFEVVGREEDDGVRGEERDGRIVWRALCDGDPVTLRCVLRAEAHGVFTVNPARAENLLTPSEGAATFPFRLSVGPRLAPWSEAGR